MYLRIKDLKNLFFFDIETDNLNATIVKCMVAKNAATQQIWRLTNVDEIRRWFSELPSHTILVGHNIISFDVPVLRHLLGIQIPLSRLCDTLTLSYLWSPYLEGGHSLDAWGLRVGVRKIDIPDFASVSDDTLLKRCETDVEITQRTWHYLKDVMLKIGYSELSCEIEHWTRYLVNQQEKYGFYFNINGADTLYTQLRDRQQILEENIKQLFQPRLRPVKTYRYRLKQNGEPFGSYQNHLTTYPELRFNGDYSEYTTWDWEEFNLASPNQRVSRLLELGWEPQKFTKPSKSHPEGQPQVDEDSLVEASQKLERPELKAMAEWLVCFGRANMINTWLNFVNRDDSRIHGKIFTCGALSRRFRHAEPNTANIPGNEAKFGYECRSLWEASPGRILLGNDAKGIQMRIMGHYTDLYAKYPEIFKIYLGKPHQRNADLIGNGCTYKQAKNDFFAFIFGCYDKKLGNMHGIGNKQEAEQYGSYIRSKLFESVPGLKGATEESQAEWRQNKGRLKCLDGGYVICPGQHAAFNYKVQPGEAVIMKLSRINFHKKILRRGLDIKLVGSIHDEFQDDCLDQKTAEEGKILFNQSIQEAGEILNLKVPLASNGAIGRNWAETHT